MIKKLRKKFAITAFLSIFTLLTLILVTINFVNFSLVSNDADKVLDRIVSGDTDFKQNGENMTPPDGQAPQEETATDSTSETETATEASSETETATVSTNTLNAEGDETTEENGGPNVGPNSKDMGVSARYFTVTFDSQENVIDIRLNIFSFDNEEAESLARDLINKKSGWTKWYYRYKVYEKYDETANLTYTCVTVIDQSRELLPSYRVLIASIVGELIGLIITAVALIYISNRFTDPIVKADEKQRRFVSDAAFELKEPITLIDTNTRLLELEYGKNETTDSIFKQIDHLTKLVQGLDLLLWLDNNKNEMKEFDLSEKAKELCNGYIELFNKENKNLQINIEDNIKVIGDYLTLSELINIVLDNALKYSKTHARFDLTKIGERTTIVISNDCENIPNGDLDSVFERFYRSEDVRKSGIDGAGTGLSIAKEIVTKHKGRIKAYGELDNFIIKIEL